jgi:hypothetical protein
VDLREVESGEAVIMLKERKGYKEKGNGKSPKIGKNTQFLVKSNHSTCSKHVHFSGGGYGDS